MKNVSLKLFAVLLAVIGIGIFITSLGSAHPQLIANDEETSPQPGELLDASPTKIQLLFDERTIHGGMDGDASQFFVVRVKGATLVARGSLDLDNPFRDTLVAHLDEPLSPGLYEVIWNAVSAGDNGFTEGRYTFAIQGEDAGGASHDDGDTHDDEDSQDDEDES